MTPQQKQNFNGLLNRTLQPRTSEPGLPYFNILYKTVENPVIVEVPVQPAEPAKDPMAWFPWVFGVALVVIVGGLIAFLPWACKHGVL